jgi:hypothetical protein
MSTVKSLLKLKFNKTLLGCPNSRCAAGNGLAIARPKALRWYDSHCQVNHKTSVLLFYRPLSFLESSAIGKKPVMFDDGHAGIRGL